MAVSPDQVKDRIRQAIDRQKKLAERTSVQRVVRETEVEEVSRPFTERSETG